MIREEIRKIKGNRREWRKFGLTMAGFFMIVGGALIWRGRATYPYFFILSLAFLLLGAVAPSLLKPVYKIWMSFAVVTGWVMTRVILCFLFYFVLTPLAFLARISGKKFMELKFREPQNSYWIQKPAGEKSGYDHQY